MTHEIITCIALPATPNHVCPNCGLGWICVDTSCPSGPILPCPSCYDKNTLGPGTFTGLTRTDGSFIKRLKTASMGEIIQMVEGFRTGKDL